MCAQILMNPYVCSIWEQKYRMEDLKIHLVINFWLFRGVHTVEAGLEPVVDLVKYISKVNIIMREVIFRFIITSYLHNLLVKIRCNEPPLKQLLAKCWHLLYGQVWPGQNVPKQNPPGWAVAVTAQQWSSKCGNNLAYGSDDFVETEWQCQECCCFLEGAEDFSSDESPTVFRCRKLLWCLEEGDLAITSIMLHFVSNSRSRIGVREEKCCSMVCIPWCCRNTFLFPCLPLS